MLATTLPDLDSDSFGRLLMRNATVIMILSSALSAAMADMSVPAAFVDPDLASTIGIARPGQFWDADLSFKSMLDAGPDVRPLAFGAATWRSALGRLASGADDTAGRFAAGKPSDSYPPLFGIGALIAGDGPSIAGDSNGATLGHGSSGFSLIKPSAIHAPALPTPSATLLGMVGLGMLFGARRRMS